jgi:hypothetical protein
LLPVCHKSYCAAAAVASDVASENRERGGIDIRPSTTVGERPVYVTERIDDFFVRRRSLAHAGTITYEQSGIVSGSIGGVSFSGPITFYLVADTVDISSGAASFVSGSGPGSLSISSLSLLVTTVDVWDVFANKTAATTFPTRSQ